MTTGLLADRVLSLVEQRLRDVQAPVNVRLWNGQTFAPPAPSPVTVTVRSPRALMNLAHPSLGALARSYVEGDIDFEGNMREVLRLGELLVADEHEVYQPRSNLWKFWRHTRAADRRNIQQLTRR